MNRCLPCLLPALVVLAALAACSRPPQPARPTPTVTVATPQVATLTNWDEYPGHLEAVEMVEIRPRVSGYVDSIHFTDGAEVKAGDLLFVIDPKPYQAELDRAAADRRQAETRLDLARDLLGRAESLRGTKAISEEELDTRSRAVRQAEAGLASAQAAEAAARLNLDYTRITAPISGKIGRRLITTGNLVQPQGGGGATVLATLVSVDPVYCYFDVEEGVFVRYRSGVGAGSRPAALPCELALVNEEGFRHHGHLDFFDNQVSPQTGTLRLRAVFENPDRSLVPGMYANLRVPAGPPESMLLIPDVAIGSDQGYKFVYVVRPDNTIETRSIQTGRAHGALRAVTKGLTAGDRVVVNGLMTVLMLPPGAKVVPQAAADGTAASGAPNATASSGGTAAEHR